MAKGHRSKGNFLWTLRKEVFEILSIFVIDIPRKLQRPCDLGLSSPEADPEMRDLLRNWSQERPVREWGKQGRQERKLSKAMVPSRA